MSKSGKKQKNEVEVKDDLYEIKQFLKKKKIQNEVLQKMIEKPDFDLLETKNTK